MNRPAPLQPATLAHDADGTPMAPAYGDVYHPRGGPWAQARHVFLGGNRLPARWAGRERFTVLETGFGLGNNLLALWDAWRQDPQRCGRLHVVAIERHPLRREDLCAVHSGSPLRELADRLIDAWPPLTPDLHRLEFEDGRVQLSLCFGDVADWLPQLVCRVDAYLLDGFAPARNPAMWTPAVMKALGRLAAPGATAATWSSARAVRDGLRAAGFVVERAPGIDGKREITVARHEPRHVPVRPPARRLEPRAPGQALVIGGGLAGAAVAWALAREGWTSTVLERRPAPAAEASGNPGGLFHGIVTPQDGPHARFGRAAALRARAVVAEAIAAGVAGAVGGLDRLESSLPDAAAIRARLDALGLPPDYVCAATLGARPAWHYPGGGWVDPGALVRHWLDAAGAGWRGGVAVERLVHDADGWRALAADGRTIAAAPVVVVCAAADAPRLLGAPGWPVEQRRGQLSIATAEDWAAAGLPVPVRPVSGAGYLLPLADGRLLFGATTQPDDADASVREADHRANLDGLERLLGRSAPLSVPKLQGRTAWRFVTDDRLPIVGPAVRRGDRCAGMRLEQPRFVPREDGLYVLTALGSRGIAWAPLAAQALAGWIAGSPLPLGSGLLDAIDPARFVAREARRAAAQAAGLLSSPDADGAAP